MPGRPNPGSSPCPSPFLPSLLPNPDSPIEKGQPSPPFCSIPFPVLSLLRPFSRNYIFCILSLKSDIWRHQFYNYTNALRIRIFKRIETYRSLSSNQLIKLTLLRRRKRYFRLLRFQHCGGERPLALTIPTPLLVCDYSLEKFPVLIVASMKAAMHVNTHAVGYAYSVGQSYIA